MSSSDSTKFALFKTVKSKLPSYVQCMNKRYTKAVLSTAWNSERSTTTVRKYHTTQLSRARS